MPSQERRLRVGPLPTGAVAPVSPLGRRAVPSPPSCPCLPPQAAANAGLPVTKVDDRQEAPPTESGCMQQPRIVIRASLARFVQAVYGSILTCGKSQHPAGNRARRVGAVRARPWGRLAPCAGQTRTRRGSWGEEVGRRAGSGGSHAPAPDVDRGAAAGRRAAHPGGPHPPPQGQVGAACRARQPHGVRHHRCDGNGSGPVHGRSSQWVSHTV